jgi:hypothetical protein
MDSIMQELVGAVLAKDEAATINLRAGRKAKASAAYGSARAHMAYLLPRNIRIESDLTDHLFNSSEKRLARLLLLLANFGKEGQPLPIIAPIGQKIPRRNDRHDARSCQVLHEPL